MLEDVESMGEAGNGQAAGSLARTMKLEISINSWGTDESRIHSTISHEI